MRPAGQSRAAGAVISGWPPRTPGAATPRSLSAGLRAAAWLGCLLGLLVLEGFALAGSPLWAVPLLCALLVALAAEIPLVPFLAVTLLVRVLTDDVASSSSRYSASVDPSGAIAVLLILLAAGLLLRVRRGVGVFALATGWLAVSTLIAVRTHGASPETIREGVREMSVLAVAAIALNARGTLSVPLVTRLIQFVAVAPALLALVQFATHTGADVEGQIRSNGTFSHPNGAAMFFAIAAAVSLWRYMECGRRRTDGAFTAIYSAATIATFSLTGLAGLLAMLVMIGTLKPGSARLKLGAYGAAAAIAGVFLLTPLGAERIANESQTQLSSAQTRGTANTSFAWRLYKWGTLIPEWERSPLIGQGLGSTVTAEGNSENVTAGKVPHNEYLRYLVETGILGLAILIAALAAVTRALARRRRVPGGPDVGLLGLAVLAGCLLNAAADNTFLYSNTGYLLALLLGAILSVPARSALSG